MLFTRLRRFHLISYLLRIFLKLELELHFVKQARYIYLDYHVIFLVSFADMMNYTDWLSHATQSLINPTQSCVFTHLVGKGVLCPGCAPAVIALATCSGWNSAGHQGTLQPFPCTLCPETAVLWPPWAFRDCRFLLPTSQPRLVSRVAAGAAGRGLRTTVPCQCSGSHCRCVCSSLVPLHRKEGRNPTFLFFLRAKL